MEEPVSVSRSFGCCGLQRMQAEMIQEPAVMACRACDAEESKQQAGAITDELKGTTSSGPSSWQEVREAQWRS